MSTMISKLTFVAAALFTCAVVSGCTGLGAEETESAAGHDGIPSSEATESDAVDDDAAAADDGEKSPDGYHEE